MGRRRLVEVRILRARQLCCCVRRRGLSPRLQASRDNDEEDDGAVASF